MNIKSQLREFGNQFTGRIEKSIIENALNYIDYNESSLGFEILCEQLYEYDVLITIEEYETIKLLNKKLHISEDIVNSLKELIR